jgi:type IV secretory pathway VirJ component
VWQAGQDSETIALYGERLSPANVARYKLPDALAATQSGPTRVADAPQQSPSTAARHVANAGRRRGAAQADRVPPGPVRHAQRATRVHVRAHRECGCAGGGERTARNCESMLLSVKEHVAKGAEEMARVGRLASLRVSRYCI